MRAAAPSVLFAVQDRLVDLDEVSLADRVAQPGVVVALSRSFSASSPAREGETLTLSWTGVPGDLATGKISLGGASVVVLLDQAL